MEEPGLPLWGLASSALPRGIWPHPGTTPGLSLPFFVNGHQAVLSFTVLTHVSASPPLGAEELTVGSALMAFCTLLPSGALAGVEG